jgi:hypothetical protein
MKKTFIVIAALLAVGLTAAAHVQAQDMAKLGQLQKEVEQIEARVGARGGAYTEQELERLAQIAQETVQAMGSYGGMIQQYQQEGMQNRGNSADAERQAAETERMVRELESRSAQPRQTQPQQAVRQQGEHAGWPSAAAFQNRFKITPLRQPAGTTARYDAWENKGVIGSLEIFLTGGNAATALQNLKQQIEAVTGRQMTQDENVYYGFIHDPNYKDESNLIRFRLEIESNGVTLSINPVAG